MQLDRRLVGWGITFIVIGAVPLAVNAGLVDRDVVGRWPEVWPLLVVAIGLSLILTRTRAAWVGSLTVALVVGVMLGGLVATGLGEIPRLSGCGGGTAEPFDAQSGTLEDGSRLDVEFDCGTLTVGTNGAGGGWNLTGADGDGQAPVVEHDGNAVTIHAVNRSGFLAGRGKVAWTLDLPTDTTFDFGVTLNAGQGDLELADAKLASFNGTVNAGSMTTVLGATALANAVNLTVNAGTATLTTAATSGDLNLSLNAGSLQVCVPQGSAAQVHWSGELASHDLDGLGLVKVDAHTWTTTGFDPASPHLELDVSANAGSFNLHFGGGCDA